MAKLLYAKVSQFGENLYYNKCCRQEVGTFQKIHSQEETGLPNGPDVLGKLIDSLYYNIVAKLWCQVAVAV